MCIGREASKNPLAPHLKPTPLAAPPPFGQRKGNQFCKIPEDREVWEVGEEGFKKKNIALPILEKSASTPWVAVPGPIPSLENPCSPMINQ